MRKLTSGLNTLRIITYNKNTSKKTCLELNFLQKSQRPYKSIFPKSGARVLVTIPGHYNISNMTIF